MLRPTISMSSSKARSSAEPVTGSAVMTVATRSAGSRPSASTRLRRSRSVTIPTSRLSSMSSSDETPRSRMVSAASRMLTPALAVSGRPGHELAGRGPQPRRAPLADLGGGVGLPGALAVPAVEELLDGRLLAAQVEEDGGGDGEDEGVLDRGELVGRGRPLQQRRHPEGRPALGALDEVAVAVADVDGPRPEHVHHVGRLPDAEDQGAAADVADLEPGDEAVEHRLGQGVERRVLRQEVPDLDQLGVHDPRIMARPDGPRTPFGVLPSAVARGNTPNRCCVRPEVSGSSGSRSARPRRGRRSRPRGRHPRGPGGRRRPRRTRQGRRSRLR